MILLMTISLILIFFCCLCLIGCLVEDEVEVQERPRTLPKTSVNTQQFQPMSIEVDPTRLGFTRQCYPLALPKSFDKYNATTPKNQTQRAPCTSRPITPLPYPSESNISMPCPTLPYPSGYSSMPFPSTSVFSSISAKPYPPVSSHDISNTSKVTPYPSAPSQSSSPYPPVLLESSSTPSNLPVNTYYPPATSQSSTPYPPVSLDSSSTAPNPSLETCIGSAPYPPATYFYQSDSVSQQQSSEKIADFPPSFEEASKTMTK